MIQSVQFPLLVSELPNCVPKLNVIVSRSDVNLFSDPI